MDVFITSNLGDTTGVRSKAPLSRLCGQPRSGTTTHILRQFLF